MTHFEPDNTSFLDAMKVVATNNTPETRTDLYEAMLNSTFYLPTPADDSPTGVKPFQRHDKLRVITLHLSNERVAWPLFTDKEAMLRWKSEISHYYLLNALDLFALADKHDVDLLMINPAGPMGGQVAKWEIKFLALGEIPDPDAPRLSTRTLEKADVKMVPPTPKIASEKMLTIAKEVLETRADIQSAYIFLMAIDPLPPQLVLGVRFYQIPEKPYKDEIMRTLSKSINDQLVPEKLGLIVLSDKLFEMAKGSGSPVFER